MVNYSDWLERRGVNPMDVPMAILTFKSAAFITWCVMTVTTVRYRPMKRIFTSGTPGRALDRIRSRYPKFYANTERRVTTASERMGSWRITQTIARFQPIKKEDGESETDFGRRKRRDLGLGIAEGYIMYKFTIPLWATAYLYWILLFFSQRPGITEHLLESFKFSYEEVKAEPVTLAQEAMQSRKTKQDDLSIDQKSSAGVIS